MFEEVIVEPFSDELLNANDSTAKVGSGFGEILFITSAVAIASYTVIWNIGRRKTRTNSLYARHLLRNSCRNCRFFAANSYLKCAVHPDKVLKIKAIDCSDYCLKQE